MFNSYTHHPPPKIITKKIMNIRVISLVVLLYCHHSVRKRGTSKEKNSVAMICFCAPENSYIEILRPNVMVLGGEAFGR